MDKSIIKLLGTTCGVIAIAVIYITFAYSQPLLPVPSKTGQPGLPRAHQNPHFNPPKRPNRSQQSYHPNVSNPAKQHAAQPQTPWKSPAYYGSAGSGQPSEQKKQEVIRLFDKNGDGKLSSKEFQDMFKSAQQHARENKQGEGQKAGGGLNNGQQ